MAEAFSENLKEIHMRGVSLRCVRKVSWIHSFEQWYMIHHKLYKCYRKPLIFLLCYKRTINVTPHIFGWRICRKSISSIYKVRKIANNIMALKCISSNYWSQMLVKRDYFVPPCKITIYAFQKIQNSL